LCSKPIMSERTDNVRQIDRSNTVTSSKGVGGIADSFVGKHFRPVGIAADENAVADFCCNIPETVIGVMSALDDAIHVHFKRKLQLFCACTEPSHFPVVDIGFSGEEKCIRVGDKGEAAGIHAANTLIHIPLQCAWLRHAQHNMAGIVIFVFNIVLTQNQIIERELPIKSNVRSNSSG